LEDAAAIEIGCVILCAVQNPIGDTQTYGVPILVLKDRGEIRGSRVAAQR
jgi:hypothetical protein